ncbi:hypothetical protein LTR36_002515 [Oleoguttula mirabilis]|uniref:Uncharacterized protein n=1 Tax=Oleoguttula mirabilis TaxID=1507867 RepID=A0AAV9JKV5_9PEZI|nr:hypothetical protein LTR36_002515 [Oleoguttula mirabilis]
MGTAAAATATAGAQGGVYQDKWGSYWEMECNYLYSGATYYDSGVSVAAYDQGAAGGLGRCYNYLGGQQGTLSYNTTASVNVSAVVYNIYGSGYLLQASPNLLCPDYNGTYYTDPNGVVYYILCGFTNHGGTTGYNSAGNTTVAAQSHDVAFKFFHIRLKRDYFWRHYMSHPGHGHG